MAETKWKILDVTDLVLGRFSSIVAKMALMGEKIVIVNSAKAKISGNRRQLIERYLKYKKIKTASNPRRGPFRIGTRPDIFVRKTIKGMLPKNWRGKQALSRIHTYIYEIPEEKKQKYGEPEKIELPPRKFHSEKLSHKMITVDDLCTTIGWNHGGMI